MSENEGHPNNPDDSESELTSKSSSTESPKNDSSDNLVPNDIIAPSPAPEVPSKVEENILPSAAKDKKNTLSEKAERRRTLFHKIVNVFIAIGVGLFFIILILFGFIQTSTFRKYFKEKLIVILNEETKGQFSIGEINGTFITTLTLKDVVLKFEGDTVASVEKLDLRLAPMAIFQKVISVKELSITRPFAIAETDSLGILNFAKIFPSSGIKDTTESKFPFKIEVSNFEISNGSFSFLKYTERNILSPQPNLNIDNLRVNDFSLKLSTLIDIDSKSFKIDLDNLSFKSNIRDAADVSLNGKFSLTPKDIKIDALKLKTSLSDLTLNLSTKELNIFDFKSEMLKSANLDLNLQLKNFNFRDLESFVPMVDMLSGDLSGELNASGLYSNLNIESLNLKYQNTDLSLTGRLEHLDTPLNLTIDAKISKSFLDVSDINQLLPNLSIAVPEGFETATVDTLTFVGKPLDFKSRLVLNSPNGTVRGDAKFDFTGEFTKYECVIEPSNLDLRSIANFPTNLSGRLSVRGEGFSVKTANIKCDYYGDKTIVGNKQFSKINLSAELSDGYLTTELNAVSTEDSLSFAGGANFTSDSIVSYKTELQLSDFNIAPLLMDSTLKSKVNLILSANAKGFKPDDIEGGLSLVLNNSRIFSKDIKTLNSFLKIKKYSSNDREIKLISDLADFTVRGNFSIPGLVSSVVKEQDAITKIIISKLHKHFPSIKYLDSLVADNSLTTPDSLSEKYNVRFNFAIKDSQEVKNLFPQAKFEFDGNISGNISRTSEVFHFDISSNINFLKLETPSDRYFLTNTTAKISISKPNNDNSFVGLNSLISFESSKFLVGQQIDTLMTSIKLAGGQALITGVANYMHKMRVEFQSNVDFNSDTLKTRFDKLFTRYSLFELTNARPFNIYLREDGVTIKDFEMKRNDSKVIIDGDYSFNGTHNLSFKLQNFKGYDLSYSLFGIPPIEAVDADLNIDLKLLGTSKNLIFTSSMALDNVSFRSNNFGSLKTSLDYSNQMLSINSKFINIADKKVLEKLALYGAIPLNLNISTTAERLPSEREIDLHFAGNNFDVAPLSVFMPMLSKLKGFVNGNINIAGTYNNILPSGYLRASDVNFRINKNNLDYSLGSLITLSSQGASIDSFVVKNVGNVKNKGQMSGHGLVKLDSERSLSVNAIINGDLTVLTEQSKISNSSIYGDLFIGTDGDVNLVYSKSKKYISASIIIKDANVTFPPTQSSYTSSGDNFVYRVSSKEKSVSARELEIQRLIGLSINKTLASESNKPKSAFDYQVKVKIKKEANFVFIFSQEANQKLKAALSGDLTFERKNGIENFQGELKVLDGSTLDFIKTFSAAGSLRFESDLTNPYLDITGTYKAYYRPNDTTASSTRDEEVAVKVRLKGTLHDMAKNFSADENNISIYVGATNIDKEVASPELDKADAVWFIFTGKFKRDMNQQERNKAASQIDPITGTATSLAGSLLGGLLNTYLGDYVRSLEIRNSGTATKFNLSGRFKDFRYTIGGSTNFLQDFSTANVRIEYPLFENLLLRMERRESIIETSYQNEMINELGLKYKFEF